MNIMKLLAQLEARLEGLFEASWTRTLTLEGLKRQVAYQLESFYGHGQWVLVGMTLKLHPVDAESLLAAYPYLSAQLSAYIGEFSAPNGLIFSPQFHCLIEPDPQLGRGQVTLVIHRPMRQAINPPTTEQLSLVDTSSDIPPAQAQLLLHGQTILSLESAVVNIGRRPDNHLVLDDSSVSRHHCQLRLRHDHYLIFDLNSSHGLFINHQRVSESRLRSGDIITIGKTHLLYWQADAADTLAVSSASDTRPQPPSA